MYIIGKLQGATGFTGSAGFNTDTFLPASWYDRFDNAVINYSLNELFRLNPNNFLENLYEALRVIGTLGEATDTETAKVLDEIFYRLFDGGHPVFIPSHHKKWVGYSITRVGRDFLASLLVYGKMPPMMQWCFLNSILKHRPDVLESNVLKKEGVHHVLMKIVCAIPSSVQTLLQATGIDDWRQKCAVYHERNQFDMRVVIPPTSSYMFELKSSVSTPSVSVNSMLAQVRRNKLINISQGVDYCKTMNLVYMNFKNDGMCEQKFHDALLQEYDNVIEVEFDVGDPSGVRVLKKAG